MTCNFIKKATLAQVFSSEFCKILPEHFLTEHLQATVSYFYEDIKVLGTAGDHPFSIHKHFSIKLLFHTPPSPLDTHTYAIFYNIFSNFARGEPIKCWTRVKCLKALAREI